MGEKDVQEIKTILVTIGKLEVTTENISKQLQDVLKLVSEMPAHNESLKMAHKRIDDTEILIAETAKTTKELVDARALAQADRIKNLEDAQKWQNRTIAGAIFVGLVDKFFL